VRAGAADALRLVEHGLEFEPIPPVFIPQTDGDGLVLAHEPAAASAEISRFSARDADRYRELHAFIGRIRGVIAPLLNEVPPDTMNPGSEGLGGLVRLARKGLGIRRLGSKDMMELLRVPPMCVADWLGEYFETELLKAALSVPAVLGTWTGPWSPGTAANLVAWMCTAGRSVRGGPAALVDSLGRAARHYGVEVRTGAEVERIRVKAGVATGVALARGEEISGAAVMSSCDPRTTFLQLLDPEHVSHSLERQVQIYRQRGTTAKVHLALDGPLEFTSRPGASFSHARVVTTLDGIERAFDAVKYRRFSERPMLDVYVPSASGGGYAPAGRASVSILAHFAPYDLQGGWVDAQRERLGDAVVAELVRVAPGVASSIVAREVLTPKDIEDRYNIRGGHVHHGEHALDQLIVRPTLDTARYRTPIANLYLCGSGSHPGGGVTCAPGALAAGVVAG
jgi:phytoene dehydrogenase-like protein